MASAGRHVAIVVAPERFRDEELTEARRILEGAGHRCSIVSTRPGAARGVFGMRASVSATVAQLAAAEIDALVIVGGAGAPAHLWDSEPLRVLVKAVYAAGRPVAAICLAPPVLARAGLLAGRRATTYPLARALIELGRGGAAYVEDAVVRDGSVLTASGPEAAPAFGAALAELLEP